MSDFITNGYELRGARRLHVHEEPYADKRMRERVEAKQAEKKEPAAQAAKQQQVDLQWQERFRNAFQTELLGDDGLVQAIGEADAEIWHELKILQQIIAQQEVEIADLKAKLSVENRFNEMERGFAARQLAMNEAKRGAKGERGERGARGERGLTGPRGPSGKPAERGGKIVAWKIDFENYRAVPLMDDNSFGPPLELAKLFAQFIQDRGV